MDSSPLKHCGRGCTPHSTTGRNHGRRTPHGRRSGRPAHHRARARPRLVPLRRPAPGQDRHRCRHGERLGLPGRHGRRGGVAGQHGVHRDVQRLPGPGRRQPDPTAFRKNCQLNLVVHVPQGFTYAVASADYRGFASLQRGATGTQKASYYFQGSSNTVPRTHPFNGPYNDDWQATDTTDWAQLVWAPCGSAQLQHQHGAARQRRDRDPREGQLHDDGFHGRGHQHGVPPGVEGVPEAVALREGARARPLPCPPGRAGSCENC